MTTASLEIVMLNEMERFHTCDGPEDLRDWVWTF
jgi:hypothetical protein